MQKLQRWLQPSDIFKYADDAKVSKCIDCKMDCMLFQRDIDSLAAWCTLWQLKLNIAKCVYLRLDAALKPTFKYCINGVPLQQGTSTKDLGVVFDTKLVFSQHCNTIINKGFTRANMLLRCFHSRDRSTSYSGTGGERSNHNFSECSQVSCS